jgi:hypothetical protein
MNTFTHKFEIGTWICSTRYKHMKPVKVKSVYFSNERKEPAYKSDGAVHYESECELWQPKEGEHCWNISKKTLTHIRNIVSDSYGLSFGCFSESNGVSSTGYYRLEDFEPFVNGLPSFIKEEE